MRKATRYDILKGTAPSGSVVKVPRFTAESGALILRHSSYGVAKTHLLALPSADPIDAIGGLEAYAGSLDYGIYPELIPSRRPKGYRRLAVPHPNTIRAIMRQFPNVNREQAIAIAYWRVVSDIRGY